MTRKDFELLASALGEALTLSGADVTGCVKAVACFANHLVGTNPRFDRSRFIDAVDFPVASEPKKGGR